MGPGFHPVLGGVFLVNKKHPTTAICLYALSKIHLKWPLIFEIGCVYTAGDLGIDAAGHLQLTQRSEDATVRQRK